MKPKREVPEVTEVSVVDGEVTPSNPKIPNQGILVLTNEDLNFYRVQLTTHTGTEHSPICAILPPLASLVLMGGPEKCDQDTYCKFALYKTNMLTPRKHPGASKSANGGSHTITIGSSGKAPRPK